MVDGHDNEAIIPSGVINPPGVINPVRIISPCGARVDPVVSEVGGRGMQGLNPAQRQGLG